MSSSVGTLRKLARFYKTNILDFFDATEQQPAGAARAKKGSGSRSRSSHGVAGLGKHRNGAASVRVAPQAGSGDSYTHEGEEFLYVLRGN